MADAGLQIVGAPTFSAVAVTLFIPFSALLSMAFAAFLWWRVSHVKVAAEAPMTGETRALLLEEAQRDDQEVVKKAREIQVAIEEGATSFLQTEYRYMGIFMACFAIFIFLLLSSEDGFQTKWHVDPDTGVTTPPALMNGTFSAIAFLLGAGTSILSGYMGMKIATYANARVALEARHGVAEAFMTAFRAGAVMGFVLAGAGILMLFVGILVFHEVFGHNYYGVYEAITGFGLGGSSIALFGRVGGGIYTKAADVGADLVGKVENNIPEDDPRNPAVIADNVGDNVGDVAGMGSDLFGSFAESSCAALVVASVSALGTNKVWVAMQYPLLISAAGVCGCILTTFFATDIKPARTVQQIEPTLKMQLLISTAILTPVVYWISVGALPESFEISQMVNGVAQAMVVKNWYMFVCVAAGLWGGLIIGVQTEYFTSNAYRPVQARRGGLQCRLPPLPSAQAR